MQEPFMKRCEVRLIRLELPANRCLVCYSTNIVQFTAIKKWGWQKRQIAESLCLIWSLPNNPFVDKIRKVSYCKICYEKILNLSTIYRKMKSLQTKLLDAQCKVEEEMLKSHKIYKAEENKFNIPLPWDDVRKKIISDLKNLPFTGLSLANVIQYEEEDSEDRAFLEWAEGNNSNAETKNTDQNIKTVKADLKRNKAAPKRYKKQQPVNFSEALTFLRTSPSPPPSPSALSDSDIFKEMMDPEEMPVKQINSEHGVPNQVSSETNGQNSLEAPECESEAEVVFIEAIDNLNKVAVLTGEESGDVDADPNYNAVVPCTVPGCRRKFKNSILLVGHTKKFHEGIERPYMCDICGSAFEIYQDSKIHRDTHFSDRPLMCQYCGKRFKQLRYLKDHISLHHKDGQTYQCKVCDKEFRGPSMLRTHLKTHKNERGYMCDVCGAVFRNAKHLRYHQVKHEDPERQIVCEFCPGKTFANPRNLRIHMKRHNDDFNIRCPVCNMGLENQTRLKTHMIKHSDDLSYVCDICSKRFKHKDSLNLHKKRHVMRDNDDRPFQCNICNKRFLAKRYLLRHAALHDPSSNMYPCTKCDKTFPLYHFLTKHVKKCHSDAPSSAVSAAPTKKLKNASSLNIENVQPKPRNQRNVVLQQFLSPNQVSVSQQSQTRSLNQTQQQQTHVLDPHSENMNLEEVALQISLQPQVEVSMEQQTQQVVDSIVKQVNLGSMVQVNLDQMGQPLNLDSIPQQVNLEPLVQPVNLDSIAQQINLEPMTQVSLGSIGQINLDSIAQINLEPMRQINGEQMTRVSLEPMTHVNLSHLGQFRLDSMGQLSRVNVGPMGEVNIEPLTTINIDSLPQISLENMQQQMNMESISRINMEPISQMNLDSITTNNMDSMNQGNMLPLIEHVHLENIGQQDMENDSNYFESVSIDESDSNEMVPQHQPPSCMFEAMDMAAIGMEMGPMEMEASPATTLMETLASYYADI